MSIDIMIEDYNTVKKLKETHTDLAIIATLEMAEMLQLRAIKKSNTVLNEGNFNDTSYPSKIVMKDGSTYYAIQQLWVGVVYSRDENEDKSKYITWSSISFKLLLKSMIYLLYDSIKSIFKVFKKER